MTGAPDGGDVSRGGFSGVAGEVAASSAESNDGPVVGGGAVPADAASEAAISLAGCCAILIGTGEIDAFRCVHCGLENAGFSTGSVESVGPAVAEIGDGRSEESLAGRGGRNSEWSGVSSVTTGAGGMVAVGWLPALASRVSQSPSLMTGTDPAGTAGLDAASAGD